MTSASVTLAPGIVAAMTIMVFGFGLLALRAIAHDETKIIVDFLGTGKWR